MLYRVPYDENHPKCYRTTTTPFSNEIAVLEIGHNKMPPDAHRVMKRNRYILHYVVDGRGVFMNQPFEKGDGYTVVPNHLETICSDKEAPYESYWITFRGSLAPELFAKCGLPVKNGVFSFSRSADCAAVIHRYLYQEESANEEAEACRLQACLFEVLAIHMEEQVSLSNPHPKEARLIAEFLERNYHKPLKIKEVADRFFLSQNYMYTLFKKEYGVSPQEYLLALKIEKARQLLEHNNQKLTVKSVAASVGFENPLYFTRCFHQRVGSSPSDYRKIMKKKRNEPDHEA